MTVLGSLHKKRKDLLLLILLLTFVAFTGDVLDLRGGLHTLSCSYSKISLNGNITTGIQSSFFFEPELVCKYCYLPPELSVASSFLHLLLRCFRAPPA
jgi:hypothetical protein